MRVSGHRHFRTAVPAGEGKDLEQEMLVIDGLKVLESKGRASAVTEQPFQTGTIPAGLFLIMRRGSEFAAVAGSVGVLVTRPARRAFSPRLGLIDRDVAALQVRTIESFDRCIGMRIVVHLDEAEAFRVTGELVSDQVHLGDFAELGKGLAQIRIGDAVRKVAYVNVHCCLSLKIRALV